MLQKAIKDREVAEADNLRATRDLKALQVEKKKLEKEVDSIAVENAGLKDKDNME